jgi:thiamine biosynthesis lipoprotein ApbE
VIGIRPVENKYSRYQASSVCSAINNSRGQALAIDQEVYLLLKFADTRYQLSDGIFAIISGGYYGKFGNLMVATIFLIIAMYKKA